MTDAINSGICLKCGCPLTNIVDGMTRPFCRDCEQELEAKMKQGNIGKKFPNAKFNYPPAPKE